MSCMWTIRSRLRWQDSCGAEEKLNVLLDSPLDEVSLQQSREREHDGDADASAKRPDAALPGISSFGEPTMQGLQLSRPFCEPCASLRHSGDASAIGDCSGVIGRSASGGAGVL